MKYLFCKILAELKNITVSLREKKMCTYKITIDDSLLNQVRSAFTSEAEINSWMQTQLEILLLQIAERMKPKKNNKESITESLRGIAKAPEDFDYKKELANHNSQRKGF